MLFMISQLTASRPQSQLLKYDKRLDSLDKYIFPQLWEKRPMTESCSLKGCLNCKWALGSVGLCSCALSVNIRRWMSYVTCARAAESCRISELCFCVGLHFLRFAWFIFTVAACWHVITAKSAKTRFFCNRNPVIAFPLECLCMRACAFAVCVCLWTLSGLWIIIWCCLLFI